MLDVFPYLEDAGIHIIFKYNIIYIYMIHVYIYIHNLTTFLTNKIPPAFALEIFLFAKKGGGASSRRLLANLPRPMEGT